MMAESRQVELVAVRAQIEELEKSASATPRRNLPPRRRGWRRSGPNRDRLPRARRCARPCRESEPARHRARSPADRAGQKKPRCCRAASPPISKAASPPQGKLLAERDYENNQLRQANEGNDRIIKELRVEIAGGAAASRRRRSRSLRAEKTALEEQLRTARDERAKLQRDINAIQQQAESSWATERMENALLRERINDIAAEVTKLRDAARRPELADRGPAGGRGRPAPKPAPRPANDARQQWRDRNHPTRRRRNARRAHPRAAGPRLLRPPAGRISRPNHGFACDCVFDGRFSGLEAPGNLTPLARTSKSRAPMCRPAESPAIGMVVRAHSSAGERSLHTGEVQGSIPCAPTIHPPDPLCRLQTITQARRLSGPSDQKSRKQPHAQ